MEDIRVAEEQGLACALGKICSLESRLRDAIQSTHSLHRSFGRDMGAVDRERASLLVIRCRRHLKMLPSLFQGNPMHSVPLSRKMDASEVISAKEPYSDSVRALASRCCIDAANILSKTKADYQDAN